MSTTVETTRPTTSQPARTERSGSSQFTRRKMVGLPGHPAHLGAGVPVLLPGAVDDHHQLQDRGAGGILPAPVLLHPDPGPLRRRVRARHGPVPAELVLRRGAVHRRRDAARHPGGVRACRCGRSAGGRTRCSSSSRPSSCRWPPRSSRSSCCCARQPAGQPVVTRPALPRRQPAACGLDDAVVLRRGADRRRRGRPDRRGQLQPRAVAGVAARSSLPVPRRPR